MVIHLKITKMIGPLCDESWTDSIKLSSQIREVNCRDCLMIERDYEEEEKQKHASRVEEINERLSSINAEED